MANASVGAGAASQSTSQTERPKSKTADIIVDDVTYYHPYPHNTSTSNVWNYFRCKRGVEYSEQGHCVYCMQCRSKQIDGDKTKFVFFAAKWYSGGPTTELLRHVKQKYCVESQPATIKPAGSHTTELSVFATSKWSKERCKKFTKKLVYDFCIRDKEPLSFVDRDGFRNFLKREFTSSAVAEYP